MKVIKNHRTTAPKVPFDLEGKIMFTSDKLELIHLTLIPKQKIELHVMPHDVLFFVLAGKGTLHFEGDKNEGNENTSIFVPSGALRGWENTGDTALKLLVIKDLG